MSYVLEYLYAQKIVHHDIKPQNIILRERDQKAILCDFGGSVLDPPQDKVNNGGTPPYITPEFFQNQRSYPSDIWALGLTALFIFRIIPLPTVSWRTADVYSENETWKKMANWISSIEYIRGIPPKRGALLHRILLTDPKKRATASQLKSNLEMIQKVKI